MRTFPFARCEGLAVALALAAGCAPAGPADSGETAATGAEGGFAVFRANREGFGLVANLYASASAALPGLPAADGTCHVTPHTDAGSVPLSVTDLDVGASLTLSGPATFEAAGTADSVDYVLEGFHVVPAAETLAIEHDGALVAFNDGQAGTLGFGTSWTLENSGASDGVPAGTLARFDVPGAVDQPADYLSAGSVTPGSPATVTWAGGAGADHFHVYVGGRDASADCYAVASATSLVVPAAVTAQTGADGFATVSAETVTAIEVGGRRAHLFAIADNLD